MADWTLISPVATGSSNAFFRHPCVDRNTGSVWAAWGQNGGTNTGSFRFIRTAGGTHNTWVLTSGTPGVPYDVFNRENYGSCSNPDLNLIHIGVGSPPGYAVGGANNTGPYAGEVNFSQASNVYSLNYNTIGNTAYAGDGPGTDVYTGQASGAVLYFSGAYYYLGGFSVGSGQQLYKRVISTGAVTNIEGFTSPPMTTGSVRMTYCRTGMDPAGKIWLLADDYEYWEHNLIGTWTHYAATGTKPPLGGGQAGVACLHETTSQIVVWVGRDVLNGAGADIGETYILDRATMVWRREPYVTVPTTLSTCESNLYYDNIAASCLLLVEGSGTKVYELVLGSPPPTTIGTVTAFPLAAYDPAFTSLPFRNNTSCKHNFGAYCPDDNRIYFQGGDTILGSATDGTWSVDVDIGTDWRLDVGVPVYSSLPAPHALQDGFGIVWIAALSKFFLWPGVYTAYDAPGAPIENYSCGTWLFDPLTKVYTQDRTLFTAYLVAPTSTGSLFGGIYDEVNDEFMVFGDSGGGYRVVRYSRSPQAALSTYPYSCSEVGGFPVFVRGKHVKIGRKVYILGYRHLGSGPISACFFVWHLDNHTMTELTAPSCDATQMQDSFNILQQSHGYVVWPYINGPHGEFIDGIHVYNPDTDSWVLDTQVPAYGNFIGNSFVDVADGRIAFSGGGLAYGRQQTHLWFYEVNTSLGADPVATYIKHNQFVEDLAKKVHNLSSDQFTIALSNVAPVAGNSILANLTEISYTNLSTRNVTTTSCVQTSGTLKLILVDLVLTASGAVGPFRYCTLYNNTPTSPADPLVGSWDYGSSITMAASEIFTIDFDASGGVLTLA